MTFVSGNFIFLFRTINVCKKTLKKLEKSENLPTGSGGSREGAPLLLPRSAMPRRQKTPKGPERLYSVVTHDTDMHVYQSYCSTGYDGGH